MSHGDAEAALLSFARELVGDLANGKLLALALGQQEAKAPQPAKPAPREIDGRPILATYTHPGSPTTLYDLGNGDFAEAVGQPGSPGEQMQVLHSDQFNPAELVRLGWAEQKQEAATPPGAGPSPGGAPAPSAGGPGPSSRPKPSRPAAPDVEDALAKAAEAGKATDTQHTLDDSGQVWSADRASQHNEIVRDRLDAATTVPSEGKAVLLAGLGGGKPAAAARDAKVRPDRHALVSADDIKAELARRGMVPEVAGLKPGESAMLAHPEAAHVAGLLADQLAARRKNMVIDGAMADPEAAKARIGQLRNAGYGDVRLIHQHTPVEQAVDAARSRHKAGSARLGGRFVPPSALRAHSAGPGDDAVQRAVEEVKPHVDGWERYEGGKRTARGGKPPAAGVASVEDLQGRAGG